MHILHCLLIATSVLAALPTNVSAGTATSEDLCEVDNKICEYHETCIMLNATLVSADATTGDGTLVPTCVNNEHVSNFRPAYDANRNREMIEITEITANNKQLSKHARDGAARRFVFRFTQVTHHFRVRLYHGRLVTALKAMADEPEPATETIQKELDAEEAELAILKGRKESYILDMMARHRTKIAEYRRQIDVLQRGGMIREEDLCEEETTICKVNDRCIAFKPVGEPNLTPICVDNGQFSVYSPRKTAVDMDKYAKAIEKSLLKSGLTADQKEMQRIRLNHHRYLISASHKAMAGNPVAKLELLEHELAANRAAFKVETYSFVKPYHKKRIAALLVRIKEEKAKTTESVVLY